MKATFDAPEAIDAGAISSVCEAQAREGGARRAGVAVANIHLFLAAAFVFLLPNAVFALALRPAMAAIVLVGVGAIAALLWRAPRAGTLLAAPTEIGAFSACLLAGVALCLLGGEGHFFYSTTDWITRDAVLSDLIKNGLTVLYRYEGQDYLLRAPLGMYMFPVVVGRVLGLYAAHMALLAQNSFITGTIAYFVAQIAGVRKGPFLFVLFAFSGMDIVPILIAEANEIFGHNAFLPFAHIEWWGEYFSAIRLQYSSHLTQIFWVPNHMAPGWWFATLTLLYMRAEVDLAVLLVSFAAMLLWSPLAMMGAAPFMLMFAIRELPRKIFAMRNFIAGAAGLCLVPIALYLTLDAASVPSEFLFKYDGFALRWATFLTIEIPQFAIIVYAWNKVAPPDRPLLLLAGAMLLAIPMFSVGASNDFVMRASIPPLFLLAYAFARIAVLTPRDNGAFATIISSIVIISLATPLLEVKGAFKPSYVISDCNMLTTWAKGDREILPTNYWARVEKVPSWLMSVAVATPLENETRVCWPDHPTLMNSMK
jgi:hypothetical protein